MTCRVCGDACAWPYTRHTSCTPAEMWIACEDCGLDVPGLVALLVHQARVNGRGSPCSALLARRDRHARIVPLGVWRGAS